jgi:hypothetical protein
LDCSNTYNNALECCHHQVSFVGALFGQWEEVMIKDALQLPNERRSATDLKIQKGIG